MSGPEGHSANPHPADLWKDPLHLMALGLGSGLVPAAPGTAGTLVAIPLYLLLVSLPLTAYVLILVGLFAAGCWLCERTAVALGVHDHPAIVIDEVVGFLITMLVAPAGWAWIVVGFVLFRLFDIVKPWPIRWVDLRVGGGFGIMVDDVLAGVGAWLVLQGLALLIG